MAIKKWQKIKSRRVYSGWQNIDLKTFILPNGKRKNFDIVFLKGEVVSIVGVTKNKKVVLVKQFRPGPEKIFYEFPLGLIEKGESPLKAAQREFLEETGFVGNFKKIGVLYPGAYESKKVHCFLARDCFQKNKTLKLDEAEFLEVRQVEILKVKEMLKKCQIRNFGEGYLAFAHLGLL